MLISLLMLNISACSSDDDDNGGTLPSEPASIETALSGTYQNPVSLEVTVTTLFNGGSQTLSFETFDLEGATDFENNRADFSLQANPLLYSTPTWVDTIVTDVSGNMQFDITGDNSFRLFVDTDDEPLTIIDGVAINDVECTLTKMTLEECIFEGSFTDEINIGGTSTPATPVTGTLRMHLMR